MARLLAGYERELPLLPGAVDAVRRIAARWPVGLASSANREVIDAVLAASGLAGTFGATVSGEEVARGKPAPDIYLEAARRLGADPRRSAAVEDSTNGLRCGGRGGDARGGASQPRVPAGARRARAGRGRCSIRSTS